MNASERELRDGDEAKGAKGQTLLANETPERDLLDTESPADDATQDPVRKPTTNDPQSSRDAVMPKSSETGDARQQTHGNTAAEPGGAASGEPPRKHTHDDSAVESGDAVGGERSRKHPPGYIPVQSGDADVGATPAPKPFWNSRMFAMMCCCAGLLACCAIADTSKNAIVANRLVALLDDLLGVKTSISQSHIALLTSRSVFTQITVGNPDGFKGNFMTIQRAIFDFNAITLLSEPKEIEDLSLHGVDIHLIHSGDKKSNLQRIIDHISHVTHSNRTIFEDIHRFERIPYLFVVHKIGVTKIFVTVQDNGHVTEYHLAPINVTDVGIERGERKGVHLYQLVEIITGALVKAVAKTIGQRTEAFVKDTTSKAEKGAGKAAEDAGKGIKRAGQKVADAMVKINASKDVTKVVENVTTVIGNTLEKLGHKWQR